MIVSSRQSPIKVTRKLQVENDKPIFVPPRRMHPDKQSKVDAEVDEMRRNGIVSPVKFPEWDFLLRWYLKKTVPTV
jgi:hypothetical protein